MAATFDDGHSPGTEADDLLDGLADTRQDASKSISFISRDMKDMVQKIQDLRHLGVENNGLPLPKICVVGDQSTGKSSLIESMSEIKAPRSAGCCTRCPLEINLSESKDSSSSWTCHVLLTRRYVFCPEARMGKISLAATKKKPLGPWIEQDPEEYHFITLTDKNKLADAIKWAQLATLNPGSSHTDFIPGQNSETDENHREVKFSPNVVRLDISGPKFPNLSFYDLPGVINVAEVEEERYLVSLVENLVIEYIKADNCIVILTLPMTDDATNSSAARIIREVKGAKERTVGVLTKPDRVQTGESNEEWIQILRGDKFSVGHGYFVVKNNPDPLVEHSKARAEESEFFSRGLWADELAGFRERFGTTNLQTALSKLLLEQIRGSLPTIFEQLRKRNDNVEEELSKLPDPPSTNLPYLMGQRLTDFSQLLVNQIDGGSSEYPFQKHWSQLAADFQSALISSRPAMLVTTEGDRIPLTKAAERKSRGFIDDGEDSDVEIINAPTSQARTATTPAKRKVNGGSMPASKRRRVAETITFLTEHFALYKTPAMAFDLANIREINRDTYVAGIPGLVNPKAIEKMNRMSVQHWDGPMREFLATTHKMLQSVLLEQLGEVFGHYKQTALYSELKRIIVAFLDQAHSDHCSHADENYHIEHSKPFTMATASLERAHEQYLEALKARRRTGRVHLFLDLQRSLNDEEAWEDDQKRAAAAKITDADIGPDDFSKEVEIMATIRGYYDIASARFVDSICQMTHTKLFFRCRHDLISTIERELGLLENDASEKLAILMTENPERQRRRLHLVKEKERLGKAMESLSTEKQEPRDESGLFF
ncbi:hypothetical protein FQN54_001589 [Arachnomyces sp. PD_36]|nr:hypothetical protein FQN54_001589 [Arachnomyces sp. PD_36]